MDLLIDGDIIAYRSAAACDGRQYVIRYNNAGTIISIIEKYKKDADAIVASLEKEGMTDITCTLEHEPEPVQNADFLMGKSIGSIVKACKEHYGELGKIRFFLSRGGSFREKEFPSYKGNRKEMRRPHHLEAMKDHLVKHHGAECRRGEFEADDMMAFNQTSDTVICTIDKDLLQVPGNHYNFVKKEFTVVEKIDGLRSLYRQMLTGDATDGIPGLKGIGPKTAEKMINPLSSEFTMYIVVLKAYYERTKREEGEGEVDFQKRVVITVRAHARLLYLLRTEDDSWEAPEHEEY